MPAPVEPPATSWVFPTDLPDDDLVAAGADLEPGTVIAAYRQGLFPMPLGHARLRRPEPMGWWSPLERGVLRPSGLRVSRSLRRACRDFEIRVNTRFADVVDACADPRRDHGWIDRRIRDAYVRLHDMGWAHSVEAWRDGALVGGLYGLAVGGLFAGESMFHRVRDASKVALVALVDLLDDEHTEQRLIDVQWVTPHLAMLGVEPMSRSTYRAGLPALLAVPPPAGLVRR